MLDTQLERHTDHQYEYAAALPRYRDAGADSQGAVLARVLEEIDYGLLVLGTGAQILFANQTARLELGGERLVRRRMGRLVPCSASHGATIEAALANVRRGQRSQVTLGGKDGELVLSFVPLNAGAQFGARVANAALALVILGKRDAGETTTLQEYAQVHRLTGTEQALLPAIVRGLSVKAIANQRNVSVNTVRAHLCSIRAKTGARSLRMLMACLTGVAPA